MTKGLKRARMVLKTAADLGQQEKDDLFALWKANMGHYTNLDYTDSGKWEEMYDPDARYLIIRRQLDSPTGSPLSRTLKLASSSSRNREKENGKEKERRKDGDDGGDRGERGERKRRRMRRRSKDQEEGELLGFASFRFDTEETMSTQDAEVVYW